MNVRNRILEIYFKYFKSRKNAVLINKFCSIVKKIDKKYTHLKIFLAEKELMQVNPDISTVHISIISNCNLLCKGCLYGREFMPNKKLELSVIKRTIDDIKALNIPRIHFYGGEPLLHPDIVEMIAYASEKNVFSTLGTNGVLLKKGKIDALYLAGLRYLMFGIYGIGKDYNNYVGHSERFEQLENNITHIRCTYPDMSLSVCWLLTKLSCNLNSLHEILNFSKQHEIPFSIALIHYDFPYFSEGDNSELQFYDKDRDTIYTFIEELLHLKQKHPNLISNSFEGIKSIPEWLSKKEEMQVPCHKYNSLWIGPNGIVRVCQKSTDLGNINNSRLKDIIYNDAHTEAAQNCFKLNCSNCPVSYDERILNHSESKRRYSLKAEINNN